MRHAAEQCDAGRRRAAAAFINCPDQRKPCWLPPQRAHQPSGLRAGADDHGPARCARHMTHEPCRGSARGYQAHGAEHSEGHDPGRTEPFERTEGPGGSQRRDQRTGRRGADPPPLSSELEQLCVIIGRGQQPAAQRQRGQ
jgi:hypothetical protein